jgi:drug/metabolite transporter, DME family
VRRGLLLVGLAAVTWGTTGTTLKLIGDPAPVAPLLVGAARMVVAGVLLVGGARLAGQALPLGRPAVLAGACIAAYQVCYFSAVPLAGVATTALLAICSAPVLIAVLARIVLGEPFTPRRVLALGLGIAGAGLLVAGTGLSLGGPRFVAGALLALGAGLAYSIYAVVTRRRMVTSAAPLGLAAVTFSIAAVVLLPTAAISPRDTVEVLQVGWPWLVYLGVVPTALAYALYTTALRSVPASVAAIVGLLEPLTATVLGILLFGEALGLLGGLGALLLLLAVSLLALP